MSAPTDMELMMFVDGELDEERHREVADYLEGSNDARLKLKAMGIVGEVVRKDADKLATMCRADEIVAGVFAKIDADEASPNATEDSARVVPLSTARTATASKAARASKSSITGKTTTATNDNGRLILGLAALASAAAFVLWMWGNGARPAPLPPSEGPVAQAPTEAPTSVAAAPLPTNEGAAPQATASKVEAADSGEPGVKVASVNWGENKPGAVYYVPKDTDGSTTTVVWLASE